jgi:hypothetical protein
MKLYSKLWRNDIASAVQSKDVVRSPNKTANVGAYKRNNEVRSHNTVAVEKQ